MATRNNPLRLGLLSTLGTNIGDDFIREGIIGAIKKLTPDRSIECIIVNKHSPHTVYPFWHPIRWGYTADFQKRSKFGPIRRFAERFLPQFGFSRFDSCNVVIQCGTPVIWEGCRNCEWSKIIWSDVLLRRSRRGKPVLNLGGGSCYPWERRPETLAGNADEKYIRLMLDTAHVTTVRDRLTQSLLATLEYEAKWLACPAILVGQFQTPLVPPTRKVLINYMRGAGHYDFGQGIEASQWTETLKQLIVYLEGQKWEPTFLAHNQAELDLAAKLRPDLPRFCPANHREYFEVVRDAMFGVYNRMHASVASAGVGVPSIAVGNDTRNLMVEALGLPVFFSKEASVEVLQKAIVGLVVKREVESRRLLSLRDQTFAAYGQILRPWLMR
jgi:polysaccharide pyruvyl transferase WcaK-like protein